jgi:hypothetical protein
MRSKLAAGCMAVFLFAAIGNAQQAEVTVTLNEQFFDALLDALFQNGGPEFPLAKYETRPAPIANAFTETRGVCNESIKLLRENQSVRTAVRFRDGKIYMPIAFTGNYNPPLVGCVEFGGYAEANLDLEFERQAQRLIGRVKVLNVVLSGTNGIGSSVITRMVQSSIDKKLNPIELIKLEKLSFAIPMQNSTLRMEAAGIRSEIANSSLLIHIDYKFPK